jgi:hypothetical protein
MSFWQNHMPAGMYLRSNWAASHISDPHNKLTLDHFKADTGAECEPDALATVCGMRPVVSAEGRAGFAAPAGDGRGKKRQWVPANSLAIQGNGAMPVAMITR